MLYQICLSFCLTHEQAQEVFEPLHLRWHLNPNLEQETQSFQAENHDLSLKSAYSLLLSTDQVKAKPQFDEANTM